MMPILHYPIVHNGLVCAQITWRYNSPVYDLLIFRRMQAPRLLVIYDSSQNTPNPLCGIKKINLSDSTGTGKQNIAQLQSNDIVIFLQEYFLLSDFTDCVGRKHEDSARV